GDHLRDLGGVDDTCDVDAPVGDDLHERSEYRPGSDYRRADPDSVSCPVELVGDTVCQRGSAPRREPGSHFGSPDIDGVRVVVARVGNDRARPELLEVAT